MNTRALFFLLSCILLTGCATSKEALLPASDYSMSELWQGKTPEIGENVNRHVLSARQMLRRTLTSNEQQADLSNDHSYARTEISEINQQFPRLPNPDMVMYVFPHINNGNTPVPGYSTVFSFYKETQYALPGERTEAM